MKLVVELSNPRLLVQYDLLTEAGSSVVTVPFALTFEELGALLDMARA